MVAVFSPRILSLLSLSFLASARGYFVMRTHPIYEIPAGDRVSDTQLFGREVDIQTDKPNPPFININIASPGRVFVTYTENATALNTPVVASGNNFTSYGKIKVSGSSRGLVSYLDFTQVQTEKDMIRVKEDFQQIGSFNSSDSLLVEITLFAKNSLKHFTKSGSSDAVILENVLYMHQNSSEGAKDTAQAIDDRTEITLNTLIGGRGSIFVHDPTRVITTDEVMFSALEANNGSIQVELGGLNITNSVGVGIAGAPHSVNMFVDDMSPVTLWLYDQAIDGSTFCIESKNDVSVTIKRLFSNSLAKEGSAVRPKETKCTKLPLPERKPATFDGSSEAAKTSAPAASSAAVSECVLSSIAVAVSSLAATFVALE